MDFWNMDVFKFIAYSQVPQENQNILEDILEDIQDEISWTREELQKLRDGFIPAELFDPARALELNEFFNKENLREHCYPNYENFL